MAKIITMGSIKKMIKSFSFSYRFYTSSQKSFSGSKINRDGAFITQHICHIFKHGAGHVHANDAGIGIIILKSHPGIIEPYKGNGI